MLKSKASTLDAIEAKLKLLAEGPEDISDLPVVEHKASGLSFRVGAMSGEDYEIWQNLRHMEEARYKDSGAAENNAPFIRNQSEIFLLQKSCWTEDGQNLTEAMAKQLLTGRRFGPSTKILVSAANKENPPREDLLAEVTVMFCKDQADLMLMKLLMEAGLGRFLIDKMSPNATPEEKEEAARNIDKAYDALMGFAPYYDIKQASESLGISIQEAATSILTGGETQGK